MKAPILTFFNNKGGVGKTSLVYHLAWMFSLLRKRVIVVDIDPQANLTAAFLEEEEIEKLWSDEFAGSTIYHCVEPLTGVGDIVEPSLRKISQDLYLIPGSVKLSGFEDALSSQWPDSMGDTNLYRPMRMLTSFWQVIRMGVEKIEADIVLIDIGPNLGAINRSALLASNYVAIPLGADLFSLQGLQNLGPTLRQWRHLWQKRLENWHESIESTKYPDTPLPQGSMYPIGYLCQQHSERLDRPVKAYAKWVQRMPSVYRKAVLNEDPLFDINIDNDPYCLATIKHYRSLIPMAQEVRKPIFKLTSADGAIGSHSMAVQSARQDFERLAYKIAKRINIEYVDKILT